MPADAAHPQVGDFTASHAALARLEPVRATVAVGLFAGVLHLGWSLLVATGVASPLLALALQWHFVHAAVEVTPFRLDEAIMLVVGASLSGGLVGFLFAAIWNGVAIGRR